MSFVHDAIKINIIEEIHFYLIIAHYEITWCIIKTYFQKRPIISHSLLLQRCARTLNGKQGLATAIKYLRQVARTFNGEQMLAQGAKTYNNKNIFAIDNKIIRTCIVLQEDPSSCILLKLFAPCFKSFNPVATKFWVENTNSRELKFFSLCCSTLKGLAPGCKFCTVLHTGFWNVVPQFQLNMVLTKLVSEKTNFGKMWFRLNGFFRGNMFPTKYFPTFYALPFGLSRT